MSTILAIISELLVRKITFFNLKKIGETLNRKPLAGHTQKPHGNLFV